MTGDSRVVSDPLLWFGLEHFIVRLENPEDVSSSTAVAIVVK